MRREPGVIIRMSRYTFIDGIYDERRACAILEALLHEMAHALLAIYHCHYLQCCKSLESNAGIGGHSPARMDLCEHIKPFPFGELGLGGQQI